MSLDLQAVVDGARQRLGIAGAQAAVWRDGVLTEICSGVANVDTGQAVTPDTLFSIGSTTKVHTAALVMQLVDDGLVDLDRPVADVIADFRLSCAEATAVVTPRHLMSMSSGIDNGPYTDTGRGDDAVRRYVQLLSDVPMSHFPGRGFGYSNASTNVSGLLVQTVTGQPWEEVLRTRLLEPAGLLHSAVFPEDIIWRRHAVGHVGGTDTEPPQVLRQWNVARSMGPAGLLSSTAGDLIRFARVFLSEGVADTGQKVLSAAAVAEMQRPQVSVPPTLTADFWGLGPYGKTWDGHVVLGHSGTTPVGSSYLLWVPDLEVAVATTVNVAAHGYPFAAAVFDHVFPEMFGISLPTKPDVLGSTPVASSRCAGRYAMAGVTIEVTELDGSLFATIETTEDILGAGRSGPSPLLPISETVFLPTDPAIDGNRGWGIAFLGPSDEPATHLVNGFWCLRRIEG